MKLSLPKTINRFLAHRRQPRRQTATLYAAIVAGVLALAGAVAYSLRRKSRASRTPDQLSAHDWKQALLEAKAAVTNKDLAMFAAGVAYYSTLAFFPTLVAVVSLYALVADPAQVVAAGKAAEQYMPPAVAQLITGQLLPLTAKPHTGLIAGLVAAAIALFSASGGMQNLIKALNHSYDVSEDRGFVKLRAISLALTLGLIILGLPLAGLLVLKSSLLAGWGITGFWAGLILVGRWAVLAVIVTVVLAVFYRYAPNRIQPRWQIVSWGGGAAGLIWLLGTALFFLYIHFFASYGKSYGIFAGLIILMIWLNLSAFIVLLGAEVNNRLERRTRSVVS